jgi:hypothetical protein
MARTIACHVDPSSVVELFPLHVTKDGNDYVIGRHGARSYLAVSEVALDAVMLLSRHVPVGEVKQQLARLHDVESVSIAPLLEQLLGAGLVRAIDGELIDKQSQGPFVRRSVLTRARVAPLFGPIAFTVYALVLGGGLFALIDARGLPHFNQLMADRSIGMLLLSCAVVAVMTAKHEFAHIAAGKFLGVDARWRLGHRLMFPVVETDLSDLWTIEPKKRYLAYGAGMFSDLLAGALALMLTGADARGWIALGAEVHRVCDITTLVALVALLWQCNVFLRTDGYYMLATALGCRNLAGDAKAYLRDRTQSVPGNVRVFAFGYAATVAVLAMSWLLGLSVILQSDVASGSGRAIGIAIGLALLIAGIIAERRRATSRYRLVCPVGLSAALALIASSASADQLPGPSYDISVTLDAARSRLHGRETLVMWNRSADPLDHLELHLHANAYRDGNTLFARDRRRLSAFEDPRTAAPSKQTGGSIEVTDVRIGSASMAFAATGTVLRIPLLAPLPPGQRLMVEIAFDVRVPRYVDRLAVRDGNFVIGAWFPKLAVLDERGWHAAERRGLGEFHSEAGDYQVDITVPSGFTVGATGARVSSRPNDDGTETTLWQARNVRDFAWVADRAYQVTEAAENGIAIRYLALPRRQQLAGPGTRLAFDALSFFGGAFGAYPYRDFTVAEARAVESGVAIEYPQLILINEDLVASSGIITGYEPALVHEVAHQWWYGIVGNDEIAEAWLDEALATYSTRRFFRERRGGDPPLVRWPRPLRFLPAPTQTETGRAMYVSQVREGFDQPVLQHAAGFADRQSYLAAVYYKGAAVLEMLEYILGSATFDRVLRAYVEQYAYRNARTPDFIATAERVSGRSLQQFAAQWLTGTAVCDYSVEHLDVRQQGELYNSAIRLVRIGDAVMPIVARVSFDDGTSRDVRWDGDGSSTTLTVRAHRPVRRVEIDPDKRLLETDLENNVYPRQRTFSANPFSMPADAFSMALMPLVWHDRGYEVGAAVSFGGPPSFSIPSGMRRNHGGMAYVMRNLERDTTALSVSYATPVARVSGRGVAAGWLSTEPGETHVQAGMRWFASASLYQAPKHNFELFARHDRETRSASDKDRAPFDAGTSRSIGASYVLNRLTTDYFPMRGFMLSASIESGLAAMGSDWTFTRTSLRGEAYAPLGESFKLVVAGSHGSLFGSGPAQKSFFLIEDGNFLWNGVRDVHARSLTAIHAEARRPLVASSLAAAAFGRIARTGRGGSSDTGVYREAGVGLRLFDNAPFAMQIDWPLVVDGPGVDDRRALDARRVVVNVGRVFERR